MQPATEKLIELFSLIKNNYGGILTKEDMSSIYFIIGNRIDDIFKEEKEYAKELELKG
jgi:hypothetical protein